MKRRSLILAALVLLLSFSAGKPAHADITTGLVGYYAFDAGSGTTAADSSGSNNNGTLTNGPAWVAGKIGSGALSFGGSNSFVQLPDSAALRPSAITVSAWIYVNSFNDVLPILSLHFNDVILKVSPYGNKPLEAGVYGGPTISGSTSVSPNAWHHAVLTYDGTNGTIYLDGVPVGTGTGGSINWEGGSHAPSIGSNESGAGPYFNGMIDDVRIYTRALSASDVSELYAYTGGSSGSGGGAVTPPVTPPVSDTTAPVISSVASGSLTSSSATVSWTTDESSDSQVEYGLTTGYGNSTSLNSSLVTFHSVPVSGLTASTLYHYRVKSRDASGNLATGGDNTFTTSAVVTPPPADTTAPTPPAGGWTSSVIIPPDRKIDWTIGTNVGVRGGIPTRTTICQTLPAGSTAEQINSALSSCPSGGVVKLGAGDFNISSSITVPSNVTLRGSGPTTKINSTGPAFLTIGRGSTVSSAGNVTGGYVKGSTSITISGGASLSVGDFIGVYQNNEPWVYSPHGTPNGIYSMYRVEAVSGSNVSIWPPLVYGSTGFNPKYVRMTGSLTQNAGIEDLSIYPAHGSDALDVDYPILIAGAYDSWVKGIVIHDIPNMGIFIYQSLGVEIAHVDVRGSSSAGDGYGVVLDNQTPGNTAIAVYDCIFDGLFHGIFTSGQQGSVFAYNYSTNEHAQNGTQFQTAAYNASHNTEGMMSLWEGNYGNSMTADKIHGGAAYQTVWRSRFTGDDAFFGTGRGAMISPSQGSYSWNIVGNILGNSWATDHAKYKYSFTPTEFDAASTVDFGGIYLLGYNGYGLAFDAQVAGTIIRYGNYDYWHQSVFSDTTGISASIPASLAWPSKPAWFGTLAWPPFDPSNAPAAVATAIPAGYRYVNGVDVPGPAGGGSSGGVTPPADTTAPSVSITSPSNGGTISGSVSLAASASDDTGVAGVQFKLDGTNLGSELTAAPYSGTWNTVGVSNGSHTLTAVARDAAGNTKTSSSVTVTVSNSTADTSAPSTPTGITSSSLTQTRVTLSWLASVDNVGVSGYKLFRNGTLIASPLTNTYAVSGLTANTLYTFTVSAYDAAGNTSSLSLPLSITTAANPVTAYTLSVSKSGTGIGSISGAGISCGSTCSASVTSGTSITLTATPNSDSTFDGWSGACTGTGTCIKSITSNTSVSAVFTLIPVSSGGSSSGSGSGSSSGGGGGSGSSSGSSSSGTVTSSPTGTFTPTVPQSPIISVPIKGTGITLTKNLYRGITDLEVKTLQTYLIAQGYLGGTATGYFGPLTEAGVMKYQAAHGITQTGTIGPITRASLAGGSSTPTVPTTTSGSIPAFTRSLTIGSTGTDVKYLQIFLNKHGFQVSLSGAGSPNNETSYFGPATARALGKFQASKGITPTVGYFGPKTMQVINQLR